MGWATYDEMNDPHYFAKDGMLGKSKIVEPIFFRHAIFLNSPSTFNLEDWWETAELLGE